MAFPCQSRLPPRQTKRWDELEAKTAAQQASSQPVSLTATPADGADEVEEKGKEDEPAWVQCSPRGNFYTVDPKQQKVMEPPY